MRQLATGDLSSNVVLAIDDDTGVLDSMKRVLESEGFVVLTASNPFVGIDLYETHWPEIKVVLLDFLLGMLTGDEVFEHLKRVNPHIRVLLVSGSNPEVATNMLKNGLWGFLQKPCSPEELLGRVRNAVYLSNDQLVPNEQAVVTL